MREAPRVAFAELAPRPGQVEAALALLRERRRRALGTAAVAAAVATLLLVLTGQLAGPPSG